MEKKLHDSPSDTEKNCLLKSDKKDDYTHHFLSQYAHLKAFLGIVKQLMMKRIILSSCLVTICTFKVFFAVF